MRIIITCARAPVSIEWIKIIKRCSHEVLLVDSLDYPIGRFYKNIKYIKVASPRLDFELYKKQMADLLLDADVIIPNCEDLFFLSKLRESSKLDILFFMPNNKLLLKLHNKYEFFDLLNSHIKIPKTKLIRKKEDIKEDINTILKPVYSRFGRDVIRGVTTRRIHDIVVNTDYPWVQQEYIRGISLCNYAVCENGEVISHVVYKPKYLLNNAASTYFEYYEDNRCDAFIKKFAKTNNYTGQVAFDFIDDGKDLYVLECNPRATSGLHLISSSIGINNSKKFEKIKDIKKQSYRVGLSLYILFGLKALLNGTLKTLYIDHKKAKNVLIGLPFYGQFISFYEIIKRSIKYKKSITTATTFDIEYDSDNNE